MVTLCEENEDDAGGKIAELMGIVLPHFTRRTDNGITRYDARQSPSNLFPAGKPSASVPCPSLWPGDRAYLTWASRKPWQKFKWKMSPGAGMKDEVI